MASADPTRFAALLSAAIHQIKHRESRPVSVIQDELGYALGKSGGSILEFWRKGNLPAKQRDLESLARLLATRGQMERAWLEDLLAAAGYGVGTPAFCDQLYNRTFIPLEATESGCAPFQAPAPTPHFVGRGAELEMARRSLLLPGPAQPLALVGMGGVGKSTLAAQIAHALSPLFPDGVLWVNAASAEPMDILQHWAQLFGYDFRAITDAQNRAAAVRGLWQGRRVLLVLDDARAPEQLRPLLPGGFAAALITTRDRDLAALANAHVIELPALDESHSLALLRAILGSQRVEQEQGSAQAIAHTLGHLPLALEIAARLLARAPWQPLSDMATRLNDAARRLDRLVLKDLSVRAAFAVSWEMLPARLRGIFSALGLFQARSCSFAALAAAAAIAPEEVAEGLSALVALSLAQWDGPERVRQHPLLADFARERLEDDEALARWTAYYLHFAALHRDTAAEMEAELENLMAVLEALYEGAQTAQLLRLVDALHPTWLALARYSQARRGYSWAVEAATARDEETVRSLALIRLGFVSYEQSDYPAAAAHLREGLQTALAAGNEALAIDARFYLARIAIEQNELEEADELLTACQRACVVAGDESGWARARREQGMLAYRQGDYAATAAACAEALAVQERLGDSAGVLATVRLLADTAMSTGDLDRALVYGERALVLAQIADLRAELAEAHFTLATVRRLRRDLDAAQSHAETALFLFERMGNRSYLAYTLHEQSVILGLAGQTEAALPLSERACAIQQELRDGYGRATTLLQLGDLYQTQGQREQATAVWRSGWELAREIRYPYIQAYIKRLGGLAT